MSHLTWSVFQKDQGNNENLLLRPHIRFRDDQGYKNIQKSHHSNTHWETKNMLSHWISIYIYPGTFSCRYQEHIYLGTVSCHYQEHIYSGTVSCRYQEHIYSGTISCRYQEHIYSGTISCRYRSCFCFLSSWVVFLIWLEQLWWSQCGMDVAAIKIFLRNNFWKYISSWECNYQLHWHNSRKMLLLRSQSIIHMFLGDYVGLATSPRLDRIIVHDFIISQRTSHQIDVLICIHASTPPPTHWHTYNPKWPPLWSNLVDFEILPFRIEK